MMWSTRKIHKWKVQVHTFGWFATSCILSVSTIDLFSKKVPKIWKNPPLLLTLLSKLQNKCEILSNFLAFSQYLDFKRHLLCFEWSLRIVKAVNMAIAFIRRIINTPIARPDWLKAQGRATTDVPIIVFQMVNLHRIGTLILGSGVLWSF